MSGGHNMRSYLKLNNLGQDLLGLKYINILNSSLSRSYSNDASHASNRIHPISHVE